MLNIENGRSCLYQWDVDQRLEVLSDEITEVHFVNAVTSPALVCEVYEEDGRRFANVPNILLQQSWPIQAYGCCGSRVRDVLTCKVIRRERPADYVYTETELKTFASLEERIKKLEENGGGGSGNPGKDGGYYQPTVTDGVLTWTPSKDDMPSVPASDVRGPAGHDGQPGKDGQDGTPGLPGKTAYQYAQGGGYTGTEAEFAAKLAEEVYSKRETDAAISEATKEGVYEVIGEMVVNEDGINRIEMTKDADGNPLKLKAVYLWMTMPANITESCPVLTGVVTDYVYSTFNSFLARTTETYQYSQFWISNGALNTEYSSTQGEIAGGSSKNRRLYDLLPLTEMNMVYAHTTVGKSLPVGFRVKVWGVRA